MSSEAILTLIGRLHPVILHLPIGLIVGLVALEVFALLRRRPLPSDVRRLLALLLAISAVTSAATGLLLAADGGYGGALLERHRNLGLATAMLSLIAGAAALAPRSRRSLATYGVALALATIAIVPAGHFGGEITHGVGFLTDPLRATERRDAELVDEPRDGADSTSPDHDTAFAFIDTYCLSCHGANRPKGGLEMTSIERMLAGGGGGPAIVIGHPAESEVIRRLRLAPDDDGHMPPLPRRQPGEGEIRALERWIADLAALDELDAPPWPDRTHHPTRTPVADDATAAEHAASDPTTRDDTVAGNVTRLLERLIHVETIDPQRGLLWIDFAAARDLPADEIATLLIPLADVVMDLGLAGTSVDDDAFASIGSMPALMRLDLTATRCTGATLGVLSASPDLETLILARVPLDGDAVETLGRLVGLRRLFVDGSGLDEAQRAHLRACLPQCDIVIGTPTAAEALEVEPPPGVTPVETTPDAS